MALAILTTGCSTTESDRYPYATKEGARYQEKKVRFRGTVIFHRVDGGYYTIVSDGSGEEYYPIDLPRAYCHGGLRVQVHGVTRGYERDGRRLQIYDIAAL